MNLLLQNEPGSFILSVLLRLCRVLSRQQAGLRRTFKPHTDQFIFEIALLCLKHSSVIAFLSVWQTGGPCSVDGIFPLWLTPRSTHCKNTHLWCQAWSLDASKTFFCLPWLKFGVPDVFLNSCCIVSRLRRLPWAAPLLYTCSVPQFFSIQTSPLLFGC